MAKSSAALPSLAGQILVSLCTRLPLSEVDGRLLTANGETAASVDRGVARFPLPETDTGIAFYRDVGGAQFLWAGSGPLRHDSPRHACVSWYLADLRPNDSDVLIVDVGGGDGRDAILWLDRDFGVSW
jgi:hypothetical protein